MMVGGTTVSNREHKSSLVGERENNDLFGSTTGVMDGEDGFWFCESMSVSCRLFFAVRIDDKMSR